MRLREQEMELICSFIARTARRALPGCLYISGPPGTGKTACVNAATRLLKESTSHKIKANFVHCMSEANTRAFLCTLLGAEHAAADASCDDQVRPPVPRAAHFCNTLMQFRALERQARQQPQLIVLDECDRLLAWGDDFMQRLFALPFCKGSQLVLIGIANAGPSPNTNFQTAFLSLTRRRS
jgi:cell division control protein 6